MGRAAESQAWVDGLRGAAGRRAEATARLHELLLQTARSEFERRQPVLPAAGPDLGGPDLGGPDLGGPDLGGPDLGGPDLGGLAQEAATGAFAAIMSNLEDWDSQVPFTIWARKFAVAEVSAKVARQLWRAGSPAVAEPWEHQLPGILGLPPGGEAGWRGLLTSLLAAVQDSLSIQQRAVFKAALVNRTPTDVLALEFGSTRSGVYKSLFEARRQLRDRLARDGYGTGPLAQGQPGLARPGRPAGGDPGRPRLRYHLPETRCLRDLRAGGP